MENQLSFADCEYRQKRPQTRKEKFLARMETLVPWHVAERPGKVRTLKKHPRINKVPINIEYMKASIRAKVEHPFRRINARLDLAKRDIED